MQQTKGWELRTMESLMLPNQESHGESISEIPLQITPIEKAKLPIALIEEAESTGLQVVTRMEEQFQAVTGVVDVMEVERLPSSTSQGRVSLGPLDQNVVRELTVASEANKKIGKWKRLARSGQNNQEQSSRVLVDEVQESGQKRLLEQEGEVVHQKG